MKEATEKQFQIRSKSGFHSQFQPKTSSDEFWSTLERVHGEIPKLVKFVLRINGFDSFLALKGFRYDEKEFFASLEKTVKDFLESDFENSEKQELSAELATQCQSASNFRIKPGHRSYIMNLMLEIEKSETSESFQNTVEEDVSSNLQSVSPVKDDSDSFMLTTSNEDLIIINRLEHGYSRDEEYECEEYLSNDESIDSTGIIGVEFDNASVPAPKLARESDPAPRPGKRRPEHMYNYEFMAKCVNPRRRRVASNKTYPNTDEGTRERFKDLLFQSMECILPRERMPGIETDDILVEKSDESDTTWIVFCPICNNRIRLAVVYENGGRYCNYKRSNFERHLRFKHCKGVKQETLGQDMVAE